MVINNESYLISMMPMSSLASLSSMARQDTVRFDMLCVDEGVCV